MSKICTFIAIPEVIVEGSTYAYLIGRSPGACHDGVNRVFNDYDPNAIDPIETWIEYPPIMEEENYIDRLVSILSPILYADDRTRPIHIEKPIMSQLYNHPTYQVCCEEYRATQEQPTNINKEP